MGLGENFRRYNTLPAFEYKGLLISPLVYYKGNSDLVHSWDLVIRGDNLSKMLPDQRQALGITEEDMRYLDRHVQGMVNALEGRR